MAAGRHLPGGDGRAATSAPSEEWPDLERIVENARNGGARLMPAPPFMHGAAHWMAFNALEGGNTVVLRRSPTASTRTTCWSTVEREKVNVLLIVGDAFARPLIDELERRHVRPAARC